MPLRVARNGTVRRVFYKDYVERLRLPRGNGRCPKCGIEKTKSRMVSRSVFLDVARVLGETLADGYGITCEDLDKTAQAQGVKIKRGDYVIVRTGQMEAKLKVGSWDGYPGGDAPGFAFETLEWIKRTELAALASDTWGCEVRPNESEAGINQPWHWITISWA